MVLTMGNSVNFKHEFKKLFSNFDELVPGRTYMFELISRNNRIVTRYDDERVVLIGARNLDNLKEFNNNMLDKIAEEIKVDRPKRFKATNVEECRHLFQDMNDDEEGLVVVDKNMNRFKLKQESYLKMAKIISMKDQDVLDFILGRAELDADFTEMPELQDKIVDVKKVYNEVRNYCEKVYWNIRSIENQKEFASHALNYKIKGVLFSMRKGMKFDDIVISWKNLQEYHSSMVVPTKNKLIILRGLPGCGKSTWIKENNLEQYAISMDTIRLMFAAPDPYISQDMNQRVYDLFVDMIGTRMLRGGFTILDAINITDKSIKKYLELAELYRYEVEYKTFEISLEEALERNSLREKYKQVPEDVITRMHGQFIQTFNI